MIPIAQQVSVLRSKSLLDLVSQTRLMDWMMVWFQMLSWNWSQDLEDVSQFVSSHYSGATLTMSMNCTLLRRNRLKHWMQLHQTWHTYKPWREDEFYWCSRSEVKVTFDNIEIMLWKWSMIATKLLSISCSNLAQHIFRSWEDDSNRLSRPEQGRRKHFQIEGAPKVQTANRK